MGSKTKLGAFSERLNHFSGLTTTYTFLIYTLTYCQGTVLRTI